MSENVQTDWGSCDDEQLRAQLLVAFPHAVPFHEAITGRQCGFPTWNMRPDADGTWRSVLELRDAHRLVCGAPTTSTEPPYCSACLARIGGRVKYTRQERDAYLALRRRKLPSTSS